MPLRFLPILFSLAASTPAAPVPAAPAPAAGVDDPAAVIRAVERGDYRGARALLADLIVAQNVRRADEHLGAGEGEEAMLLLDEALELRPTDPTLLAKRGDAAYAAAEKIKAKGSASGAGPQFFYEDALEHYLRAGSAQASAGNAQQVVRLAFDASRAARRIPDPQRALQLARAGAQRLALLDPRPELVPPPEQTHAEAAFDVYISRVQAGEEAKELFKETQEQLTTLLGNQPTDSWAFGQLSNLYQWSGDTESAIATIERALELSPDVQMLHDRLMALVPAERGWPALVEWSAAFAALHPRSATVQRNNGVVRLFGALARFDQGEYGITDDLTAADQAFARARELDPALKADCLGYQAIVRDAIGWCYYNQGLLSEAKRSFLSMEDLFEGGIQWQLPGRLPDGLVGLGFVIGKLAENPVSLSALGNMVEAAAIADYLFAYRPEDGNHANNAGFMNRDAAVLFERKARGVRNQAQRASATEQREQFEREAQRLMARAYELMDRSAQAYRVAARILSEDVRVTNDAALVMVYYTRDATEEAEKLLLRAIELGGPQLEDTSLSDEDRYALNEAWGDAHQNMAVLELTLRRNGAKAKQWLTRALEIGPKSREQRRPLLDVCDALIADPDLDLATSPMVRNMVWLHRSAQ
jgi:tetratricopeptide (TPR) repeat protein